MRHRQGVTVGSGKTSRSKNVLPHFGIDPRYAIVLCNKLVDIWYILLIILDIKDVEAYVQDVVKFLRYFELQGQTINFEESSK